MQRFSSLMLVTALAAASNAAPVFADDNEAPFVRGSVRVTVYDGIADDLLSAGLKQADLIGAAAPYTDENVPGLLPPPLLTPAASDRIVFGDGVLAIPERRG